jgi:hypothetical protein
MRTRLSVGLALFTLVLMVAAGRVDAQTVTSCTGNLAAGNYAAVDVPAGATCTITSGTVNVTTGGVTVGAGASFFVAAPVASLVITSGSFDSTGAHEIELTGHIHGHVHLTGTIGLAGVTDSFIGGTVSVKNSVGVAVGVDGNTVGGSVLLENNQATCEGECITVGANTIGGNLVCKDNAPSPIVIRGPNTVGGNTVGQCSGF